jgi:hypothetical protein
VPQAEISSRRPFPQVPNESSDLVLHLFTELNTGKGSGLVGKYYYVWHEYGKSLFPVPCVVPGLCMDAIQITASGRLLICGPRPGELLLRRGRFFVRHLYLTTK